VVAEDGTIWCARPNLSQFRRNGSIAKCAGKKLFITHQDRRRFVREARETPPPIFGLITWR
jgi:hypothetical protein